MIDSGSMKTNFSKSEQKKSNSRGSKNRTSWTTAVRHFRLAVLFDTCKMIHPKWIKAGRILIERNGLKSNFEQQWMNALNRQISTARASESNTGIKDSKGDVAEVTKQLKTLFLRQKKIWKKTRYNVKWNKERKLHKRKIGVFPSHLQGAVIMLETG